MSDTGSSLNYISIHDTILPAENPIAVQLADGSIAHSTHTATLNLPGLPRSARLSHIFPTFPGSLISTGVLCDAGCIVTYDQHKVEVANTHGVTIITGDRDHTTGLWFYNITPPSPSLPVAAPAAFLPTLLLDTTMHLAKWYHATYCSPSISTFIAATQDPHPILSLPNLSPSTVRKLSPTIATFKGHLDQKRQHLDSQHPSDHDHFSTHPRDSSVSPEPIADFIMRTIDIFDDDILHIDLSGRYPTPSMRGYQYVLIIIDTNGSYIKAIPMPSKSKDSTLRHTRKYFTSGKNTSSTSPPFV